MLHKAEDFMVVLVIMIIKRESWKVLNGGNDKRWIYWARGAHSAPLDTLSRAEHLRSWWRGDLHRWEVQQDMLRWKGGSAGKVAAAFFSRERALETHSCRQSSGFGVRRRWWLYDDTEC